MKRFRDTEYINPTGEPVIIEEVTSPYQEDSEMVFRIPLEIKRQTSGKRNDEEIVKQTSLFGTSTGKEEAKGKRNKSLLKSVHLSWRTKNGTRRL